MSELERRAEEVAMEIHGLPLNAFGLPKVEPIAKLVLAFARAEVERELIELKTFSDSISDYAEDDWEIGWNTALQRMDEELARRRAALGAKAI